MTNFNKTFIIILVLALVGLIYLLSPILTPFLIAALLAYLTDPIVEKLIHWRIPRLISVIIVFLALFSVIVLLILLIIPLIQKQIVALVILIPKIISWIQNTIFPWLHTYLDIQFDINVDIIKNKLMQNWMQASDVATGLLKTVLQSSLALVLWLTNLILIPVVTFYLLRDWKIMLNSIRNLLPRHWEPTVVNLMMESDTVLSAFFRGQLLVMISLAVIYSIGLTMIGLGVGVIIGIISGMVSLVPYLGFIIGIVSASIAAYVQFGTIDSILLVWLIYAIGQTLESTVLTPKLIGDRIGLHPVAVIFAILAGGSLFGFFGVLLALPVAAVIMVWLRFLNRQYRKSHLYK